MNHYEILRSALAELDLHCFAHTTNLIAGKLSLECPGADRQMHASGTVGKIARLIRQCCARVNHAETPSARRSALYILDLTSEVCQDYLATEARFAAQEVTA
jgi:hypothetical protein